MSETVIREVATGVVTFSKPFSRFGLVPLGGRSTAIKLKAGGVWVLASTPLDTETKTRIDALGPVKYIIGADAVHHLFLSDFKKAYPDAKLIAPEPAIERHGDKDLKFDGAWGRDPADTKYGFEDEIEHCYFSAFKNKDVAFLHKDSKSLIEADLLFNLPPNEQYSKSKSAARLPFQLTPFSWLHAKFTWSMAEDVETMKRDAHKVANWNFDRIIPCHGDVIETGGVAAWKAAYKKYFE